MKIIISHDIDHITVWEHLFKDLIIPKFLVRSKLELWSGKISFAEYFNRLGDLFKNKWNGVDEVIEFNKNKNIKSSFFIGVNNGVGLSYPLEYATPIIKKIIDSGFEIGVHGIDFDAAEKVKNEFETFKKISGLNSFGIRMHYLRNDKNTLSYIEQAGYSYDSTEIGFKDPYKIGNMWEFPLQIMDGWMINGNKRWQKNNLEQAKKQTLQLIEKAEKMNLKYLSILFHDRYFSESFITWKHWYIWLVEYLQKNNFQFVTYKEAVKELENKL